MSNKNRKEKSNNIQKTVSVKFPDSMSKEDMIEILSSAILKADELRAAKETQKQREEDEEWRQKIGLKDYSKQKWFLRHFLSCINTLACLCRILFMKKEKINGNYATNGLLKFSVLIVFRIARCVFCFFAIVVLLSYPLQHILDINSEPISMPQYLFAIPFAIMSIVIAQMFRMAEIEIEKMKDRNYIIDIFAAVMAVVAIIVSLIWR